MRTIRDYMLDPPEVQDYPACPCCGNEMYSLIYVGDEILGCDYCFNYSDITEEEEDELSVYTADEWYEKYCEDISEEYEARKYEYEEEKGKEALKEWLYGTYSK